LKLLFRQHLQEMVLVQQVLREQRVWQLVGKLVRQRVLLQQVRVCLLQLVQ
jgi:hypothetical protein